MDRPIIHIAYAEDHALVRKGIIELINQLGEMVVDIEADNGKDLLRKLDTAKSKPEMCILDLSMQEMNGFDTIIELKKKWPDIGVLVLTMFDIEAYIIRSIINGANGYLLKNCRPQDIKQAVFSICNNGVYYSETAPRQFFQSVRNKNIKLPNLTAREIIVLKKCCSDFSYAEIATQMGTTKRSVEGYRDSLFRKLNVNSRVSLALLAVQFGIVPIEIYTFTDSTFDK